ncbi:MAG: hypothetical protein V1690_01510, partial [Candidatus Moraniibacteriota bacterium]
MSKELNIKKAIYIGLVLTLILTWPFAWHFFTGIPGRGADTYQAIARTTLVQQQISDNGWRETLRWQKDADFWGILPLIGYTQALIGQMAGYNLWWFFSFFLAFLGMWVFTKDITRSNWAAAVAGFIFAFAPFHFAQATATNIGTMHYEWLPWLAFFLHRFVRDPAWKYALGSAIFVILTMAAEHQLLAFTLIFLIFYFPFLIFLYPESLKKWRLWAAVALGLIVVFAAGAVQFGKIWEIAHSDNNFLLPPYEQVENYSADVIDFLVPASFHTFWGKSFNGLRENLTSNQEGRQSFYLGYLAILLVVSGLIRTFRNKAGKTQINRRFAIFFAMISLVFIILSLGPTLHLGGAGYLSQKLPYYWLYVAVPYWNYIRTTSRIFVIALFGWAFLAGLGAKALEKISREQKVKSTLMLGMAGIMFIGLPLEYSSVPVPNLDLAYSPFYDQLGKDPEKYNILEIPGSTSYEFGSYSTYTQRIHRKEKIDGIDFARSVKDHWGFQRNTPVIENLLYGLPTGSPRSRSGEAGGKAGADNTGSDIVITDYNPVAVPLLDFYNIRYITVSKKQTGAKFGAGEFQNTVNYIEQQLGLALTYEDEFLKAYKVPSDQKRGHFLAIDASINDSWGQKEGTGKSRGREAKDGAKMHLVNMNPQPINLEASFKTSIKYLRRLEVLLDGAPAKNIFMQEFKG